MALRLRTTISIDKSSLEAGDRVRLVFEGDDQLILVARDIPDLGHSNIFLCLDPSDPAQSRTLVARLGPSRAAWGSDNPSDWGDLALWSRVEIGRGVYFKPVNFVHSMYVAPEAAVGGETPPVISIEPLSQS